MAKARKKKAVKRAKKKVIRRVAKKPAKKAVRKVRCMGKTREGKRCKRMVTPPAKLCHLHKKQK